MSNPRLSLKYFKLVNPRRLSRLTVYPRYLPTSILSNLEVFIRRPDGEKVIERAGDFARR